MKPSWVYDEDQPECRGIICDLLNCSNNIKTRCTCIGEIHLEYDGDMSVNCSRYVRNENCEDKSSTIALNEIEKKVLYLTIKKGIFVFDPTNRVGPIVDAVIYLKYNGLLVEKSPNVYVISKIGKDMLE